MLDLIVQILSVVGIIILVLLALLVVAVLLVLFVPITYWVSGRKDPEATMLAVRVNWLFGLLRVRYAYPEPGKLIVKFLCFTLHEQEMGVKEAEEMAEEMAEAGERAAEANTSESKSSSAEDEQSSDSTREGQTSQEPPQAEAPQADVGKDETQTDEPKEKKGSFLSKKITKIKYTISNIYDKIKRIWENISYYTALLREKESKLLLSHAKLRLWKILKSIRPRKLKADILFGTGAPDTTGYAYGVYGMFMPLFGPSVIVTPDFQRAVFQGSLEVSGHITVVVLVGNLLRLLFDRRLWRLKDKLKGPEAKTVKA